MYGLTTAPNELSRTAGLAQRPHDRPPEDSLIFREIPLRVSRVNVDVKRTPPGARHVSGGFGKPSSPAAVREVSDRHTNSAPKLRGAQSDLAPVPVDSGEYIWGSRRRGYAGGDVLLAVVRRSTPSAGFFGAVLFQICIARVWRVRSEDEDVREELDGEPCDRCLVRRVCHSVRRGDLTLRARSKPESELLKARRRVWR